MQLHAFPVMASVFFTLLFQLETNSNGFIALLFGFVKICDAL